MTLFFFLQDYVYYKASSFHCHLSSSTLMSVIRWKLSTIKVWIGYKLVNYYFPKVGDPIQVWLMQENQTVSDLHN